MATAIIVNVTEREVELTESLKDFIKVGELLAHPSWPLLEKSLKNLEESLTDSLLESTTNEQMWYWRGEIRGVRHCLRLKDFILNEQRRITAELAGLKNNKEQ